MVCSEVQSRATRSQNPPRGLHEEGNSASTKKKMKIFHNVFLDTKRDAVNVGKAAEVKNSVNSGLS